MILPQEASQCSKCGNPAEFGYTVQGITQWFCAEHRLSQNYADARLRKVSEGKQPTNDELKDELAGRAEHIRKVLRCLTKDAVEHIIIIGRNLVEAREACPHGEWLPWLKREFGWPRAKFNRESDRRFGSSRVTEDAEGMIMRSARKLTMGRARDQLFDELRRLGATNIVVSSNVPLRRDGLPYADESGIDDPGVAVYFTFKKRQLVMARDRFVSVAGNMRSLTLAIEAMRQLARHGGDYMMERAFTGFLAIAPPDWKKPWREVFGIKSDWSGDITALYREKARLRHPDAGGSAKQHGSDAEGRSIDGNARGPANRHGEI